MSGRPQLTCLNDWLVSRSCAGNRREQRRTHKSETHADISISGRKMRVVAGGKDLQLRILQAEAEKEPSSTAEIITSSWAKIYLSSGNGKAVFYLGLRSWLFYYILLWLHLHLSGHGKTRTWKMSVVSNPTGDKSKQSFFSVSMTNGKKKKAIMPYINTRLSYCWVWLKATLAKWNCVVKARKISGFYAAWSSEICI